MTTHHKLTVGFAAARIVYAAAGIAAPRAAAGPWLGEAVARGGGRVAARALLARDALLSVGLAESARRGSLVRPWLAALIASDLVDIVATLVDREHLPERSAPGTAVLAGAAALAGTALYRNADA